MKGFKFSDDMIEILVRYKSIYDQMPGWINLLEISNEVKSYLLEKCKQHREMLYKLLKEYTHE